MGDSGPDGGRGPSIEETMAMRLNVINEIIATERDFVRDLHIIIEHIMKPLEDKTGQFAKLFTNADISTLFSNIAMIEVMCADLLKLFEQAASEAPRPADAALGKAYIAKKIALTASFSAYCANQSKALTLFESMKKKASFNNYLQSIRDHPSLRGLGLLDWLIKPVQRVTKHPLLLRELEKYTPPNHSDRENTVLAAKAVQELVDQVNIAAKQMESVHQMIRIADEVSDIPSSLQLKASPGRYFVTEAKFVKVSHGKHQERHFWLFSDLIMYARPNVASLKKYSYKGTIILSKSNYEDIPDGNEFGANAIRITRLDSKKTYIIYCKEAKQKVFWLTNINELKDLGSKGTLTPMMPTIGVAKINHTDSGSSPVDIQVKASADTEKSNNSLIMWSVAVRIAGWTNEDQSRTLLHECAVKCKPFGKDVDYCFMFTDGWMGTKIKLFKTAQSSKNAVDFKVFVPFELMLSFSPKSDTAVEVAYTDPDGKNGTFVIEYDNAILQKEALKLLPADQLGKIRDSSYTKRISHQNDGDGGDSYAGRPSIASISRSQTSAQLSLSTPSLPRVTGPPIPTGYGGNTQTMRGGKMIESNGFGSSTFGGPQSTPMGSPPDSQFMSTYGAPGSATFNNTTLSSSAPTPAKFGEPRADSAAPPPMPSTAHVTSLARPASAAPLSGPAAYRKTSPRPTTPQGLTSTAKPTAATSQAVNSPATGSASGPPPMPQVPGKLTTGPPQGIPPVPNGSPAPTMPGPAKMGTGFGSPSGSAPKKVGAPPPLPKTPTGFAPTGPNGGSPSSPMTASTSNPGPLAASPKVSAAPTSLPAKVLYSPSNNGPPIAKAGPAKSPVAPTAAIVKSPTPTGFSAATTPTSPSGGAPKSAGPPMPSIAKLGGSAPSVVSAPPKAGAKAPPAAVKKWGVKS